MSKRESGPALPLRRRTSWVQVQQATADEPRNALRVRMNRRRGKLPSLPDSPRFHRFFRTTHNPSDTNSVSSPLLHPNFIHEICPIRRVFGGTRASFSSSGHGCAKARPRPLGQVPRTSFSSSGHGRAKVRPCPFLNALWARVFARDESPARRSAMGARSVSLPPR